MTQLLRWLFLKFYSDLHDNLVIGILEIDSVLPRCCSCLCFQFGGAVQVTTSFIGDHAYCPRPRATYRDFSRISIILKFRAFLQLFPRFSLKTKQNTEIEFRLP